ncbi:metallophosphoesterase [Cryobacterium psychrophilum]|uniref:Uncharacterized protein n=1 Tax=Cryobacterium psychrophilum TaxID=41988 RepID=A0A4Y8KK22_9MICO|nr:metallophosphoesterase [Cryobacterium psychrophilum]TDW30779.1 calcineurin-like phosphoesterase family protein [Cryobacterium psychrophilum]TFD75819.1 hypothetical protein E3T53_15245 [Cryobacterium psychrophilum]
MKRRTLARHEKELGFLPEDRVRWLAPGQLLRTAVQVVLAEIFANYGDKRELQEVFSKRRLRLKERPRGDLWIDFTADLGDGFDATASVASLLGQDELSVRSPGDSGLTATLPRGHLLILGGDEVYPTASASGYENRTLGPYAAALPADTALRPGNQHPSLLALPGNHDWYDGLSAFLRIFRRPRRLGAWHAIQTRSYFALRLGHGWWLAGLDSQLGEYIDEPQLNYFRQQLTNRLRPGDAIILCTASPTWVGTKTHDPDAFNQLHYFERHFLRNRYDPDTGTSRPTGAHVRVWLSGDSHHYTRYEQVPPRHAAKEPSGWPTGARDPRATQLITCGLGGAFLAATHKLPSALTLPSPQSRMRDKDQQGTEYRQAPTTYPDRASSLRMSARTANPFSRFWLGWRNPTFPPLLGGLHLLVFLPLVWLLGINQPGTVPSPMPNDDAAASRLDVSGILMILTAAVLLVSIVAAVSPREWLPRTAPAVAAVGLQITVLLTLVILTLSVPWPITWSGAENVVVAAIIVGAGGALLGTEVFALFTLTQRSGGIFTWQMSSQAVEDHKGFLRMRLHRNGDLEIFPLVIDTVCRDWTLVDAANGQKRPVPSSPLTPRLLEPPILVSRKGFRA